MGGANARAGGGVVGGRVSFDTKLDSEDTREKGWGRTGSGVSHESTIRRQRDMHRTVLYGWLPNV